MDKSLPSDVRPESPSPGKDSHAQLVKARLTDVDLKNLRALMFGLVSVCIFCGAVLFGPPESILPTDGDLEIPIAKIEVQQGSFLHFGPIMIILLCLYTYLFLFRVLLNLKEQQNFSDEYIFTMRNWPARIATYFIFFWIPNIVIFAFALKGLPRPESTNLLAFSLIFLLITISLQLLLWLHPKYFVVLMMNAVAFPLILSGLVVGGQQNKGWLNDVRQWLYEQQPLTLLKIDLAGRDLRGVDISKAVAVSIQLKDANLTGAILKNAKLTNANLEAADFSGAKLNCSKFEAVKAQGAIFVDADLSGVNLSKASLQAANFNRSDFSEMERGECINKRAILDYADLREASFKEAHLSTASFFEANLVEAEMKEANAIKTNFRKASLERVSLEKAELQCAIFSHAGLIDADLSNASLEGAVFYKAEMNEANLENTDFGPFNCKDEKFINTLIKCRQSENKISSKRILDGEPLSSDACTSCEECSEGEPHAEPANLKMAHLNYANLINADLRRADLFKADLQGTNLQSAELGGANLEGANLFLANLTGVTGLVCDQLTKARNWKAAVRGNKHTCGEPRLNFEEVSFLNGSQIEDGTDFDIDKNIFWKVLIENREGMSSLHQKTEKARMNDLDLSGFNLMGVWLHGAQLNRVILTHAILEKAELKGVELEGANLSNARLREANLTDTKLKGAILREADLHETDLYNADLNGVDLHGVKNLTCEQLTDAINWEMTKRSSELKCGGRLLVSTH